VTAPCPLSLGLDPCVGPRCDRVGSSLLRPRYHRGHLRRVRPGSTRQGPPRTEPCRLRSLRLLTARLLTPRRRRAVHDVVCRGMRASRPARRSTGGTHEGSHLCAPEPRTGAKRAVGSRTLDRRGGIDATSARSGLNGPDSPKYRIDFGGSAQRTSGLTPGGRSPTSLSHGVHRELGLESERTRRATRSRRWFAGIPLIPRRLRLSGRPPEHLRGPRAGSQVADPQTRPTPARGSGGSARRTRRQAAASLSA
jgi:hypothetical protein